MIPTLWLLWMLGVPQVTGTVVLGAVVFQLIFIIISLIVKEGKPL